MSAAYLHLLLVHLPVLFMPFALALFGLGLWRGHMAFQKLALGIFLGSAILSVPTFLTGEPSEEQVENLPLVSESLIEEHEEAGEFAFYLSLLTGGLAIGAFVYLRRRPRLNKFFQVAIFASGAISSLALARTAKIGGQIRHSEIRNANSVVSPESSEQDDD